VILFSGRQLRSANRVSMRSLTMRRASTAADGARNPDGIGSFGDLHQQFVCFPRFQGAPPGAGHHHGAITRIHSAAHSNDRAFPCGSALERQTT